MAQSGCRCPAAARSDERPRRGSKRTAPPCRSSGKGQRHAAVLFTFVLDLGDLDLADLAGGAHMGAAAGLQIDLVLPAPMRTSRMLPAPLGGCTLSVFTRPGLAASSASLIQVSVTGRSRVMSVLAVRRSCPWAPAVPASRNRADRDRRRSLRRSPERAARPTEDAAPYASAYGPGAAPNRDAVPVPSPARAAPRVRPGSAQSGCLRP